MEDLLGSMALVCRALLHEEPPPPGYRSAPELMANVVNGILAEGPEALEYDGVPAWSLRAVLELAAPPREDGAEWPGPAALEGATLVAVLIADHLCGLQRPAIAPDVQAAVQCMEELSALLP